MVAVVLFVGEVALRLLVVRTNTEEKLGTLLLYPRQWKKTQAAYLSIIDKADQSKPYVVPDEDLGWTLGSGRSSQNGLYFIGNQGIRTARAGEVLNTKPRPCRIALVGDSFTFGESVAFEDTWGSALESALQGHCQVLNFGVPGYGVDQMYLRYLRDVRPWHPDIVILAFISDDVARTMSVYSFLTFPDAEMPFSKPRFVFRNGGVQIINRPLVTAREVFSVAAIRELPFIALDRKYEPMEWDQPRWDLLSHSYLFRLLTSLYPVHKLERPETSMAETVKINGALFLKFQQAVIADGGKPFIVHLPSESDILGKYSESVGVKVLKSVQLAHVDVTPCMRLFSATELFNAPEAGGHFL
ncbi:MAG: SGNH/GDSL hydrolase family protein [Nitrospira sp.]|nr:SGNH/GDSL hydrolase family protein [Nitrospira sp.]